MAVGDRLQVADKATVDTINTKLGTPLDSPSSVGSIHAKIKSVLNVVETETQPSLGKIYDTASPTGSVHAKLKDIKASIGGGGTGVDGDYKAVTTMVPFKEIARSIPAVNLHSEFAVDNDYLYVAPSNAIQAIAFDKRNLNQAPIFINHGMSVTTIAIDTDGTVFVGGGNNTSTSIVKRYARSSFTKNTPTINASHQSPTNNNATGLRSVVIAGNYVVAGGTGNAYIIRYDKANLTNEVRSAESFNSCYSLATDGDFVYVASGNTTISKVRVSDMVTVATSPIYGAHHKIVVDGEFVYASDASGGVRKYNKSNLSFVDSCLQYNSTITDMVVQGDYIYASGTSNLMTLVVLNKHDLTLVTTGPSVIGSGAKGLIVEGNYLYRSEPIWNFYTSQIQHGIKKYLINGFETHYVKGV